MFPQQRVSTVNGIDVVADIHLKLLKYIYFVEWGYYCRIMLAPSYCRAKVNAIWPLHSRVQFVRRTASVRSFCNALKVLWRCLPTHCL